MPTKVIADKLMADVFISYAHKDVDFQKQLRVFLTENNKKCWVDAENIAPSSKWWKEICLGIESSDNFIFILSQSSLSSFVCNLEVAYALAHHKRIIPLKISDFVTEHALNDLENRTLGELDQSLLASREVKEIFNDNVTELESIQWIQSGEFRELGENLLKAIDTDFEYIHEHTRIALLAKNWIDKKRQSSSLMRGKELESAEKWLISNIRKSPSLTEAQVEYLSVSRKTQKRFRRILMLSTGIALVIISFLVATALAAQRASERNQAEANSLFLANASRGLARIGRYDYGLTLAFEANTIINPPVEAQHTLVDLASFSLIDNRISLDADPGYIAEFSSDAKEVLVSHDDKKLILWDVITGKQVRAFNEITDRPSALALSNNKKLALTGYMDGSIILWDTDSGKKLYTFIDGHALGVYSLAFSPDDQAFLSGSGDSKLILWDLKTYEILHIFSGNTSSIYSVAFNSNGSEVATGGENGEVVVWDVKSYDLLERLTRNGHNGQVLCVSFSPDGTKLVTGATDRTLIVWNLETGLLEHHLLGHTASVRKAIFSQNNSLILSSGLDNRMLEWKVNNDDLTDLAPIEYFQGHTDQLVSISFSQDGKTAVSLSRDRTIITWDIEKPEIIKVVQGDVGNIFQIKYNHAGTEAITVSELGKATLWDLKNGELIRIFDAHNGSVNTVAFSPDDRKIITGGSDNTLILWDLQKGNELRVFKGHIGIVVSVDFSPDGEKIISGSWDQTAILWDEVSGAAIQRFNDFGAYITNVAFSPNGHTIAISSDNGLIRLFDTESRQLRKTFQISTGGIRGLAFSPDGKKIAAGIADASLIIWNMDENSTLNLQGHTASVTSVDFNSDGTRVLSSSIDGSLILWDTGSGEMLRRFIGYFPMAYSFISTNGAFSTRINNVDLSPDGHHALSSSADGSFTIWNISEYPNGILDWTKHNRYLVEFSCDDLALYRLQPCRKEDLILTQSPNKAIGNSTLPSYTITNAMTTPLNTLALQNTFTPETNNRTAIGENLPFKPIILNEFKGYSLSASLVITNPAAQYGVGFAKTMGTNEVVQLDYTFNKHLAFTLFETKSSWNSINEWIQSLNVKIDSSESIGNTELIRYFPSGKAAAFIHNKIFLAIFYLPSVEEDTISDFVKNLITFSNTDK